MPIATSRRDAWRQLALLCYGKTNRTYSGAELGELLALCDGPTQPQRPPAAPQRLSDVFPVDAQVRPPSASEEAARHAAYVAVSLAAGRERAAALGFAGPAPRSPQAAPTLPAPAVLLTDPAQPETAQRERWTAEGRRRAQALAGRS